MIHLYNLADARLNGPSIVTIGSFDGVHRGHQHLVAQLVYEARRTHHAAIVLTLFPHPDKVLRGQRGRYYLTTPEQRATMLGTLGVDVVVTHPFDDTVRQIRAADFIDQLRTHLNMASLWVTADFAMGYRREGNFAFLVEQGMKKGFSVHEIDLVTTADNRRVSSSIVREALSAGDVAGAAELLGRPYTIEGPVIRGDQRGHQLGFPTANIAIWSEQILPRYGVYACWAYLDDERFMAVTNIGQRPTFDQSEAAHVEAHLLDFDREIYGKILRLALIARLRDEQKFSNLEMLTRQISLDAQQGRALLSTIA